MTTTVLNRKFGEVENEIPNVTDLVKKNDYGAKKSEIKISEYF